MSIGNGLNINSLEFKDKIFINVNTNDRKQLVIKYGDSPIFVYEGDTGRIYIYNNSEWQQIIETEINYYDLDDTRVISDETTELTKTWSSQKITDSLAVIAAALAELQSLDTPPASPVSGNIYYDTLINAIGVYTGTVWKYFGQVDTIAQDSTPSVTIGGTSKDVTISIADASSIISGLLNPSFFDLLNNSTNSGTPSTLVKRDSNGDAEFNNVSISGTPTNGNHLVTKTYVDGLVDPTLKTPEPFTLPGAGASYPTTYGGNSIQAGDSFRVANSGTLSNGVDSNDDIIVNPEDLLIAIVDNPGTLSSNWQVIESNRDQATETVKGVVELATQSETNNGTDDLKVITPLKLLTWIKGILPNKGDILTSNGSNLSQVSAGADGAVLVSDSSQASGLKWASNIIGGNPNYISNERADVNINGASTYADAAGAKPVDGTGGSAHITLVRNTLNQISGVGDFLITKDAANRQGEGVSIDFNIDDIHKAKMLQITSFYKIRTGTFTTGDLKAFIYDITNGVIIEPNNLDFENIDSSLTGQFVSSFPTNLNSGSYRLCFHIASTSTSGWALSFNDVRVWGTEKSISSVISDWQEYNLTIKGTTSDPVLGTHTKKAFWRRVGSDCEVRFDVDQTSAGTAGNGQYYFNLPFSIDTTKTSFLNGISQTIFGSASAWNSFTSGNSGNGYVIPYTDSNVLIIIGTDLSYDTIVGSTFFSLGGSVRYSATFKFPVAGWGTSGLVYSGDTQRPVTFSGSVKNTVLTANVTPIDFTVVTDSHNKFSSGIYTIPKPAFYLIAVNGIYESSLSLVYDFIVFIDGAQVAVLSSATSTKVRNFGSFGIELNTGQTIEIRANANLTTFAGSGFLTIAETAGNTPSIIVNEPVACRYTSNSGQSIPDSTETTVIFEDIDYDTHSSYSTSTGVYTCPIAGEYDIFAQVIYQGNSTGVRYLRIFVNGALYSDGTKESINITSGSLGFASVEDRILLSKGDTIVIKTWQNSTSSLALTADGNLNRLLISKR